MTHSLLDPPHAAPPRGDPAGPAGPDEPPSRGRRVGLPYGRRGLALLLVVAALLGGGVSTAILGLAGALDGGADTAASVAAPGGAGSGTPVAANDGGGAPALDASALYASASPGVVDITSQQGGAPAGGTLPPPGQGGSGTATGTGFVIDGQGHVLTAAHVVDGASKVTVTFQDGTTRAAQVLGRDDATDVAVLAVDPSGLDLHPLSLGSASSLEVGDAIAAIGDPFGFARSLSTGVVSGLNRSIQAPNGFTVANAIQTDAALNPGNSGGPVLDAHGQVIGIADQIATNGTSDASAGVGFAVSIDTVKAGLPDLIAGRTAAHAYLGVALADTPGQAAGATIADVTAGGPAAAAGLRAGDVVTSIGGTAVQDGNDLVAAIAAHKPGDQVTVSVRRGGATSQVDVTLGRQPSRASTG